MARQEQKITPGTFGDRQVRAHANLSVCMTARFEYGGRVWTLPGKWGLVERVAVPTIWRDLQFVDTALFGMHLTSTGFLFTFNLTILSSVRGFFVASDCSVVSTQVLHWVA